MVVSGPYISIISLDLILQLLTMYKLLGGLYLGGMFLLSPLTLALAYTYAQENPNMQINYFIITFSAKWLPIVMLIGTAIMASPGAALLQSTGLVAAHAYDFLTIIWPQYGGGRTLLKTPTIVQRWFAPLGGTQRRGAGTAFNVQTPAAQNVPQRQAASGGGWASGFGGGSGWGERGPGRRLGD
jgi:Derlin-2/3